RIDLVFRSVLADVLHAAKRERPDEPHLLDVVSGDLAEPGIAGSPIVAVHHEPVLRLVRGADQPFLIDPPLLLRSGLRFRQHSDRHACHCGAGHGNKSSAAILHDCFLPCSRPCVAGGYALVSRCLATWSTFRSISSPGAAGSWSSA